jgi:hypothetical protein
LVAPGYQTQMKEIRFDQDLDLVLPLVRRSRASRPVASPAPRKEAPQNTDADQKTPINTKFGE